MKAAIGILLTFCSLVRAPETAAYRVVVDVTVNPMTIVSICSTTAYAEEFSIAKHETKCHFWKHQNPAYDVMGDWNEAYHGNGTNSMSGRVFFTPVSVGVHCASGEHIVYFLPDLHTEGKSTGPKCRTVNYAWHHEHNPFRFLATGCTMHAPCTRLNGVEYATTSGRAARRLRGRVHRHQKAPA